MQLSLLLLVTGSFVALTHAGDITADQIKSFYSQKVDPSNYDKKVRPGQGGAPVDVKVTMFVLNIDEVKDKPYQLQVSKYFRQAWNDSRLAFTGDGPVIGNIDLLEKIWTPDTFFANAVDGYFHNIMKPNWFVRINTTGEVQISSRISQTFTCPSLRNEYNMESITCSMEIESYGFSAKDITYTWKSGNAVAVDQNIMLPNLKVRGHEQKSQVIHLSSGNYSRLVASIKLEPAFPGHFLYMKRLIPIIMTTMLSFAPYFLPASKIRGLLTIASCLTTSALVVLLNNGLPVANIPYSNCPLGFGGMNFFDYYGLTCIVFTIISVVHEVRSSNNNEKEAEAVKKSADAESQDKFRIPQRLREQVTSKAVPLSFALVSVASGIYMFFINSYHF